MRTFFAILFVICCTSLFFSQTVEAGRFGGGRSFGMSRSIGSFSRASSSGFAAQPLRSGASKWLGPIAGLIAGGLLASLFMSHGLGSGVLAWLLVGGVIWFLLSMRRKSAMAFPKSYPGQARDNHSYYANMNAQPQPAFSGQTINQYPAGFVADSFLRDAKVQFIRLQAAYDQKNLADIRQFTSPAVFAEVKLQIEERGNTKNVTEVVKLEAELLDAVKEPEGIVASVRFTGAIREEENQPAIALNEIWHFQQDVYSSNWIVAGIQQGS